MPDADKIKEFVEKLKLCIDKRELDACVDEAVRLAEEMSISASDLLELSGHVGIEEEEHVLAYVLVYVLAGAAAQGLEGKEKAKAHSNAGLAAQYLGNVGKAEELFKKAIESDSKDVTAHSNYGLLLHEKMKRLDEAEEQYKLAIEADPKLVALHYNYANLLNEMERLDEAEEQYKLAIDADQKYAAAHSNYGLLLHEKMKRLDEAEEQYKLAIETDQKIAALHYNYANLLNEMKRLDEAEEQYKLTIEADPKLAGAHSNYGILLQELKRPDEAEEQYKLAIEADPKDANAHGAYGILLIEIDNRKKAWDKTEKASSLFVDNGDLTKSHIQKAWFYELYSEKYFNQRKFHESGEDAKKAGDEYLKAAETTDGELKENFSQQGNILKAKSFVRKVPKKSWRRRIPLIGKKTDVSNIINNLKKAASYYEKAAQCPIEEKQDVCNACHTSISVFSDTLSAMDALLNKRSAEINKKKWDKSLESARLIYEEKEMKNGVALVDTLKQLIKCVDEIAVHKENGLEIQKDKCGKCFGKLTEVSENLDGALNILAEHSIEAIRDYAKNQGMGGFGDYEPKKSIYDYLSTATKIISCIIAIVVGIIAILQFLQIDTRALEYLKSILS